MWTAIGFGVIGFALLLAWWATRPGTFGKDGLQTKQEKRNKSMI